MKNKTQKAIQTLIIVFISLIGNAWNENNEQDNKLENEKIIKWKKEVEMYPHSKISTELEYLKAFPDRTEESQDNYLWNAIKICCDENANIYILDYKYRTIYKYDSNGSFIKKYRKKGQGPGEMLNPISMCVKNNKILISDTNKYEIQIYDLDLNYINSFKVFKAYINIAVNNDGHIYASPILSNRDDNLIDVLNYDGKILFSFGKAMHGNKNIWSVPNMIKIDISKNDDVYIAYEYFPYVCKYDKTGKLIKEYEIGIPIMKKREQWNIKSIKNEDRLFWSVIYSIKAKNDGFYILNNSPIMQLLEYDENGKIKNDYWSIRTYNYLGSDFIYIEKEIIKFFVMQTSPECCIEVFRPKNK
jgi:hypothetical protein